VTYEYYLLGATLAPHDAIRVVKAAAMFERAVQIDADYAPICAGLASVYASLHECFGARRIR
jgi:hypothetical protein